MSSAQICAPGGAPGPRVGSSMVLGAFWNFFRTLAGLPYLSVWEQHLDTPEPKRDGCPMSSEEPCSLFSITGRAKRSGSLFDLCTTATSTSLNQEQDLAPSHHRAEPRWRGSCGFPNKCLVLHSYSWTSRKHVQLRNGILQRYHWSTGNNAVHLQAF